MAKRADEDRNAGKDNEDIHTVTFEGNLGAGAREGIRTKERLPPLSPGLLLPEPLVCSSPYLNPFGQSDELLSASFAL